MNEYRYLTFDDRKQLEKLYGSGERIVVIASRLGVCFATIYRELKRGYTNCKFTTVNKYVDLVRILAAMDKMARVIMEGLLWICMNFIRESALMPTMRWVPML